MKPRVTLITLGVDDLKKSLAFYREGLGLPSKGIVGEEFEHGAVAFFELRPDFRIAKKAGANVVKPAHDTFYGGYAGYFQDPDGHVWEVAWNPQWQIDE